MNLYTIENIYYYARMIDPKRVYIALIKKTLSNLHRLVSKNNAVYYLFMVKDGGLICDSLGQKFIFEPSFDFNLNNFDMFNVNICTLAFLRTCHELFHDLNEGYLHRHIYSFWKLQRKISHKKPYLSFRVIDHMIVMGFIIREISMRLQAINLPPYPRTYEYIMLVLWSYSHHKRVYTKDNFTKDKFDSFWSRFQKRINLGSDHKMS